MKIRHLVSVAAFASVVACTSTAPPAAVPASRVVPDLAAQTVALYTLDSVAPRCTGVWVGPKRILTAGHCVSGDELNPLFYSTDAEYLGVFRAPAKLHSMAFLRDDQRHDLALYETGVFDTPQHVTAIVALDLPPVGSGLHFLGHTRGLSWSYKFGWVSSYREADFFPVDDKRGPWMQVSAPINKGDSGGGAYNAAGELVGVASFMAGGIPSTCFYVYGKTIRDFLAVKP